MPKLGEGDEIEDYLITFESLAMAYHWPREDWVILSLIDPKEGPTTLAIVVSRDQGECRSLFNHNEVSESVHP